jgi:hypothetical protein
MLLREVVSSRDVRARPARVLAWRRVRRGVLADGGQAGLAGRAGRVPAAMAGWRVTTTWIQRSRAAAQAVRACWRASRLEPV